MLGAVAISQGALNIWRLVRCVRLIREGLGRPRVVRLPEFEPTELESKPSVS